MLHLPQESNSMSIARKKEDFAKYRNYITYLLYFQLTVSDVFIMQYSVCLNTFFMKTSLITAS